MSTARAQEKEEKNAVRGERKDEGKRHHFRNALLISIVVAAVILWQLNPVIDGLRTLVGWLSHAEGVRRVVVGILNIGYHKAESVVGPLVHRVTR